MPRPMVVDICMQESSVEIQFIICIEPSSAFRLSARVRAPRFLQKGSSMESGIRLIFPFQPSFTTSLTLSAKTSVPFFKSSLVMFKGGMNRMTSYTLVVRMSMPFSMHFLATRAAMFLGCPSPLANSTPTIRPRPRTSRIWWSSDGSDLTSLRAANNSFDLR